jgi:ABC-type glycerol-3-phosphate transport system permease component
MSDEPLFELAPREDTRSPVGRRPPLRVRPLLMLVPAAVLVGAVLLVPLIFTVAVSFSDGFGHYQDVWRNAQERRAVGNSLVWLLFVPLVCLAGLALARLGRSARRSRSLLIGVLAAPVAVSALVGGTAFRLIFDPSPERGTVNALLHTDIRFLGPGWIWVVLGSAFAWQWTGFAVVIFRAGLGEVPRDLLRVTRTLGAGRLGRFRSVVVPTLLPIGTLVLLIALVGAARIFDLVLIAAPGAMQDRVDVAGVHWWRSRADLGDGGAAALLVAVFLFIVLIAAALGVWGLNRDWPRARPDAVPPQSSRSAVRTWTVRVLGTLAIVVWGTPLLVLLLTSVHTPRAAAQRGWWHGGFGLDSYRQAFESGELLAALVNTGTRALTAALLLLVVAIFAAYALAWGGLPRVTVRALLGVAAVLAVMPPQTVIVALGRGFDHLRLLGAPTALTLVQAAFGVPLAVLLLRNAFAQVPRDVVLARRLEPTPTSPLLTVVAQCWPAVLTVAVLEFVLVWNDFIVGLLLGGPETGQIMLVLYEQSREFTTSTGVLAAGAVVSVAIPLTLVLVTGRWLVRGLTAGVGR